MAIGTSKRKKNQAEAAERQWAANNPADYVNQNKEAMDAVTGHINYSGRVLEADEEFDREE